MENYFKIVMLIFAIVLTPLVLPAMIDSAQDSVVSILDADVEVDDFTLFFVTFAALVGAIPVFVESLKRIFKVDEGAKPITLQIFSWGAGILLTMFGWQFDLGFLSGIPWYYAAMYGFGASLAANGVADTKIIEWIFSIFPKK